MSIKKNILKINRLTILLIILLILIVIVPITYSKFQSFGSGNSNIKTAFYVLNATYQSQDLKLDNIVPSNDTYVYTFTVSNNKNGNRCETDMDYVITLTTTTNLPLTYNLYKNDEENNIIETETIETDEYCTYFKKITTSSVRFSHQKDETNTYKLIVHFPEEYNTPEYQGIVEGLNLSINSKQITE